MTETKVEYLVRTSTPVRQKEHECKNCLSTYGREVRNGEYLLVGGLLIMKTWAICAKCGTPVDWNNNDRHMRYITNSAKAR